MSQQLLQYALQLSQLQANNVATDLTYVNTGQAATLTVVVSNKGADATIDSIDFGLGPFGENGTDLATSPNDVKAILPDGWKVADGTSFTVEPTAGSAVIGTTSVTFVFLVNVNAAPGTASLVITEVSTAGTAHVYPVPITKMPSAFTLANLSAAPALVEPNATVTLSWNCSANQLYVIGFPGGTSTYTPPAGGVASWVTPAVESAYPSVTYTVSASTRVNGQELSAESSTTVFVDVPQIVSFTQPNAFYASPVTLHWETMNADHCVLIANGLVVDSNAPANPGAAGYQTSPGAHSTAYQIQAYRKQSYVESAPIYVTLYEWAFERTISWGDRSVFVSLALNADGSVLYFGGNYSVAAIDTRAGTVIGQASINPVTAGETPFGVSNSGLALSNDGATLYASIMQGQVLAFATDNLSAPPATIAAAGGPLVLTADGTTLYVATSEFTGGAPNLYAVSTATNSVTQSWELASYARDMIGSPDDGTLYAVFGGDDGYQVVSLDMDTLESTQVATTVGGPLAITRDGATLYSGQTVGATLATSTIQAIEIPGFAVRNTVTPGPEPGGSLSVCGMGTDPSGGLFVTIGRRVDAQNVSNVLYFVNPDTMTARQLSTLDSAQQGMAAIVVAHDGSRAYYANGREIVVFTSSGGRA